MRAVYILVIVVLIAATAGIMYLVLADDVTALFEQTSVLTDEDAINERVTAFVRNPYQDDYGMMRLPGYVDNTGEEQIAVVTLEIQLLDGDGNKRELVKYHVRDIAAGARKTFDANAGSINADRNAEVKVTSLETTAGQ
jgi:hypothetical protein